MTADTANIATQTLFAELTQRALDAEFDDLYDERGNFTKKRIKTKEYWYYKRDQGGQTKFSYVGPVGDKSISDRVRKFEALKGDFRQRRDLVRALIAAGSPSPDPMAGDVIEALWKAGFFRLRGVLIGTLAFQCYSGILGIRLPGASLRTSDADLAQFYDVSHAVRDSIPPILDVLRQVDDTFRPLSTINHPHRVTRFRTKTGYLVEFLTPNRGSDKHQGEPAEMPALGGAAALPLRYLDYLIHDPVRAVILHKGGIPVRIPGPERYAVHKLIIAAQRHEDLAKSGKDIAQAEHLIGACLTRRSLQLYEAWTEAYGRGPAWRTQLKTGVEMLSKSMKDQFIAGMQSHGGAEGRIRGIGSSRTKPTNRITGTKPSSVKTRTVKRRRQPT